MSGRHPTMRHADRGAALLLAIGFVVMIGAISAGLAALVTSGVENQTTLIGLRDREYAADGAIETAIAAVRGAVSTAGTTCGNDTGTSTTALDQLTIRVDWSDACGVERTDDGIVVQQHGIVFTACIDTGAACSGADAVITALVDFDQDAAGVVTHTAVQAWSVRG